MISVGHQPSLKAQLIINHSSSGCRLVGLSLVHDKLEGHVLSFFLQRGKPKKKERKKEGG